MNTQKSSFELAVDAYVADGRLAYADGEGLKLAHEADKAVAPANCIRKYALWLSGPCTAPYLSYTLFNSPEDAMAHIGRMPGYCRKDGDEAGAREWESTTGKVVVVDIPLEG